MMLSGGAQLPIDDDYSSLRSIEKEVKDFAAAVLEKSPSLSVRGERTADYLRTLGFSDVEVIGCPSLSLLKPDHYITKKFYLESNAKIAYNIETSKTIFPNLIQQTEENFDATYFPQDRRTLEMLLWGTSPYGTNTNGLPLHLNHKQFLAEKSPFHLDAPTWIYDLRGFDFSFGSRIHGNIAALLAGIPALVLAHDSRTLELCQFHHIPFVRADVASEGQIDIHELYEKADYSGFNSEHQKIKQNLLDYVKKCGFDHIYETDSQTALERYERKISSIDFPHPVRGTNSESAGGLVGVRTTELYERVLILEKNLKKAEGTISRLTNELNMNSKRLEEADQQLVSLRRSLDRILKLPRMVKAALTKRR